MKSNFQREQIFVKSIDLENTLKTIIRISNTFISVRWKLLTHIQISVYKRTLSLHTINRNWSGWKISPKVFVCNARARSHCTRFLTIRKLIQSFVESARFRIRQLVIAQRMVDSMSASVPLSRSRCVDGLTSVPVCVWRWRWHKIVAILAKTKLFYFRSIILFGMT